MDSVNPSAPRNGARRYETRRHGVVIWIVVCVALGLSIAAWQRWRLDDESRRLARSTQRVQAELDEMGPLVDEVVDFQRKRRQLLRRQRERREISGLPAPRVLKAVERAWPEDLEIAGLRIEGSELAVSIEVSGVAESPRRVEPLLFGLWTELGLCADPSPPEFVDGRFALSFNLPGDEDRCWEWVGAGEVEP